MNNFSLPPTPNWYDNGVAACAPDNTFLYASLGDLVVIQPQPSTNLKVVYKIHKERVHSINVNPEWGNPEKLVVTTGRDKNVNVFDLNTWKTKVSHAGHTTRNEKVIGATFCGSDRIVSVSENGFLILWKISDNELTSLPDVLISKDKVTCLSACPHQFGIVAFGYRRGTILVTDLRKKGSVLYRLVKHESEIVDLAWCPVEYNVFPKCEFVKPDASASEKENRKPLEIKIKLAKKVAEIDALNNPDLVQTETTEDEIIIAETPQFENSALLGTSKEYLLASSALGDCKIIIWRALTNGTVQTELRLSKPFKASNKRYYNSKPDKDNSWISLSWVAPSTLLSSSAKSELLQWNFTTGLCSGLYKSTLVHNDHKHAIFSIKAPIKIFKTCSPATWHETPLPAAWTISKDRLIINSSLLPSCEILHAYPTIAGQVNVLSTSKINPARLAISMSEDACRLVDLSSSNTEIVMMNSFEKMPHKVSAMTWHPKNENLLTFGTFDGQVGSVDACQLFKASNFYVQYRNAPVVALCWGPMPDNSATLGLYVVIFSELVMFDPNKPFSYPKVLLDGKSWVSQVAWKPDYEVCAVANKFGHISFFNKQFQCLTTTYVQSKQIRALSWHPHVTGEDLDISSCNHWLAACSNEVVVYDLEEVHSGEKIEDREKQVKVVTKFASNCKSVTSIDWSPHENGRLVAVTDVGFITIWNVKSKEVMASIKAEQFSMFSCVIWSPVHEDFVISGGKGNTLRYWKVSENLTKVMGMKIISPKSKNETNGYHDATNGDSEPEVVDKFRDAKAAKQRPKFVLALLAQSHNSSDIVGMTKVCMKLFDMREDLQPSTTPTEDDSKSVDEQRSTVNITKLFGTREDVESILKMEVDFHSKRKYNFAPDHISLWEGSIEDQISKAINSDTVTAWHVNMAPTVSHQFWRITCEAYAKQLAEEGPQSAAESSSYFLACNKITEAINVLCEHNKHREALAIAKLRLVPDDSRITEILEKFAKFSEESGNYEIAAQCYIAMGSVDNALKALIRRTNPSMEHLEFCIRLAQHTSNQQILNALLIRRNDLIGALQKPSETKLVQLLKRVDLELAMHEKRLELEAANGNVNSEKEDKIVQAYNQRSTNIQETLKQRLDETNEENKTEDDAREKDETKIEIEENKEEEVETKIENGETEEKSDTPKVDEPKIKNGETAKSDTQKEEEIKITSGETEEESDTQKDDTKTSSEESDTQTEESRLSNEETEDESDTQKKEIDSRKEDETEIVNEDEKIEEVQHENYVKIVTEEKDGANDTQQKTDENKCDSPSSISKCDANGKPEISQADA